MPVLGPLRVLALWTATSTALEETSCIFLQPSSGWRSAKTREASGDDVVMFCHCLRCTVFEMFFRRWPWSQHSCGDFVNWSIAGLNFLHANFRTDDVPDTFGSPPNAVQPSAHRHILSRVARFLDRFNTAVPGTWAPSDGFANFQHGRPAKYVDLRADAVDVPTAGATCDPGIWLGDGVMSQLSHARALFPEGVAHCASIWPSAARSRGIPAAHCTPSSRLGLSTCTAKVTRAPTSLLWKSQTTDNEPFAMGTPFLRPQRLLRCPRLANPSSFMELLLEPGECIFSNRDASAYFDTLRAPDALQTLLWKTMRDCAGTDDRHGSCRQKRSESTLWMIPTARQLARKFSLRRPCGQWVSRGVRLLGSLVCCRWQKMQELLVKTS